jgi:hypothetical protein
MTAARPIVRVRCRTCGLETVGELRDGLVYPTDRPEPAGGARQVDGYCYRDATTRAGLATTDPPEPPGRRARNIGLDRLSR